MSTSPEPSFREALPSCYAHLLPPFFDAPRPAEPHATCDRCTMAPPPGVAPEGRRFFRPDLKCCTYHPFLPNYAVGGLLGAEETRDSLGRERIRQRLAQRVGVVPAGIRPSARYVLTFRDPAGFGTDPERRCPYYDEAHGSCSVWPFREANCTTWFCKLRHGRAGLELWTGLRSYLHTIEKTLARHCLRTLGFVEEVIERAAELPETEEAAAREEGPDGELDRRALWGAWLGREEELYQACYRLVLDLDAPGLVRLGAGELEREQVRVEQALQRMLEPVLPPRLRRNPDAQAVPAPGGWMVTSYSPNDPIRISERLWSALALFDGATPTAAVRERVRVGGGPGLSDTLLTQLVQLDVLQSAV